MKFGALFVLLVWALCQRCSGQQSWSVSETIAPSESATATVVTGTTVVLEQSATTSSPSTTATVQPTVLPSSSPVIATTPNTITAVLPTSVGLITTTSEILMSKVFIAPTTSIYPSLSLDSMVQMSETTLLVIRPTSSPAPTTGPTSSPAPTTGMPPAEPSTETPTSFIDYVMDNPVGFSIVGVSLFFVFTMCGCLVLVLCCRKRLIKLRQKRQNRRKEIILDEAGDVWIVNPNASIRSDTSGVDAANTRHTAAAGALQRPADRVLILSNPQASQSSLLEYQDIPNLSASGIVMSHHSSITQLLPSAAQNPSNPSAPPKHLI